MSKKANENTVNHMLVLQFNRSWNMLQEAIEQAPLEIWDKEKNKWMYVRTVYHIIEAADFYERDSQESMKWGDRAGIDWEKNSESAIKEKWKKLKKENMSKYLLEIKSKLKTKIYSFSIEELLEKDGFHWFASRLEKYIYLLRHNMVHIGELAKTLRDLEVDSIKWD